MSMRVSFTTRAVARQPPQVAGGQNEVLPWQKLKIFASHGAHPHIITKFIKTIEKL